MQTEKVTFKGISLPLRNVFFYSVPCFLGKQKKEKNKALSGFDLFELTGKTLFDVAASSQVADVAALNQHTNGSFNTTCHFCGNM